MAVGLTTGKVDLIRLEASKQAQQKNILSSGPSVTLPIRNSRSCNALAFSEADSNYLAVGLDKVRGASSLIIWDISTFTSSLTLSIDVPNNIPPPPLRPQPQIPKLDHQATSRMDHFILQRHAPTEVVSSLAFLPSSTHLLMAGISHRWLRLFDLRSQTTGINVASKVHGIATDPFDPYRVACFGDNVVNVWDARKLHQPLLTFSERDAIAGGSKLRQGSVYANIEFSSTRRGCLATLEKDSSYVRFWDLLEVKVHSAEENIVVGARVPEPESRTSRDSSRSSRRSWAANLPWPTGDKKQKDVSELSGQSSFLASDTRRSGSSFYISLNIWPHTNSYQLNISLGHWPPLV
jgi:WD40 repeat protein